MREYNLKKKNRIKIKEIEHNFDQYDFFSSKNIKIKKLNFQQNKNQSIQ